MCPRLQQYSLSPMYPYPINPSGSTNEVPHLPHPNSNIPQPVLPPILPMLPPMYPRRAIRSPDLSAISRGDLEIPAENFHLSPSLQQLQGEDEDLFESIMDECHKFAEDRKELVRGAFKKRQLEAGLPLSAIDKSKLRSRREAKVTRVKEREFEAALKDVIRWFISQRPADGTA